MGVRLPSVATAPQPAAVTLVTTAETVILTSPPLNLSLDFEQVLLFWWATVVIGTGTTSVNILYKRGTTVGGVRINASGVNVQVTAGNTVTLSGCYADVPGAVAGQQYVVTLTQNAATANGSANDGALIALAL